MLRKTNTKAFTLVELVIVAVILAILATVGFISYEDYLVDTRDSKRLSQLAGLRDSMRLQITRGKLPLPDNSVEIRNNTTPFLYQGYAGKEVLETISYSETTMDPFDDIYYTYLVSRNRKDFQVMGFLEKYNKDVISFKAETAFANVDYSQRYPNVFGKKLGILLEQESNTPLQEISEYSSSGYIDLRDSTSNLFDAYVTDTYIISGKESELIGIIPYTTCKKIKETGGSYGDGIYNINPSGLSPFEVYCDMTVDGGGWIMVGRSVTGISIGDFGWNYESGAPRDDSVPFSMGKQTANIPFKEFLVSTYSNGKSIDNAMKVNVENKFIQNYGDDWYLAKIRGCSFVKNNGTIPGDPCTQYQDGTTTSYKLEYYGYKNVKGNFTLAKYHGTGEGVKNPPFGAHNEYNSDMPRFSNHGLQSNGYVGYNVIGFTSEQGILFVR